MIAIMLLQTDTSGWIVTLTRHDEFAVRYEQANKKYSDRGTFWSRQKSGHQVVRIVKARQGRSGKQEQGQHFRNLGPTPGDDESRDKSQLVDYVKFGTRM